METEHNPFRCLGGGCVCINTGMEQLSTLQITLQGFAGPEVFVGIVLSADT